MQELEINKHQEKHNDEIDLQELFYVLVEGKWIISSITILLSIIGVIYSLSLPNIYESKALLAPVNPASSLYGSFSNYTGVAGLAGINLPPDASNSNTTQALKKINSFSFFKNNILENIHLPDLMAIKSWDSRANEVVYDESVYDTNSNTWIRDVSYPRQQIPSAQESYAVFASKLRINLDKSTGFVTLTIKHQSPYIASQWAELVVNEINIFYRQKDKSEAEKSSSYLNQQINITGLSEIKEVLAQLLQEETKKLTLIEANTFYVFDYIDPPIVMEQKSEPNRALICILSALLGAMLSIFLVIARHYVFYNKTF